MQYTVHVHQVFLFTPRCLQYTVHLGLPIYAQISAIHCTPICLPIYVQMFAIYCACTQVFLFTHRRLQYTTPRSSYLRTDGWNVIYCTHVSSYLRTVGRHMLYTRLPIYARMSAICFTHHSFYNVHIVAIYCTQWHVLSSSYLRWDGCNKLCSRVFPVTQRRLQQTVYSRLPRLHNNYSVHARVFRYTDGC